ncbi:MAG: FecR domain-containing protein [Anaerolineales bacterium]|nr:FecR domain-containing protein [Anaerolineales bacterium]
MNQSDLLQDALARLEAGEKLEVVAASLPAEEAELLKLASGLRTSQPARAASDVQTQRQTILRAAQNKPAQPQPRPQWLLPVALSGAALAVVFMLGASLLAVGGLWWWNNSRSGAVAQTTPTETVATNPQTSALNDVKGFVQVQASDGTWHAARAGESVAVGQAVRTGALSSVTLAFFDGSYAHLTANSELKVDALTAPATGLRTIRLTQLNGTSTHTVAKTTEATSVYEVNTHAGAGRAKGTEFSVSVSATGAQFTVTEGQVEVGNAAANVLVEAGYTTVMAAGQPPAPPALSIAGEGEVQLISPDLWHMADQNFAVNTATEIVGEPQVGDWVAFEGRQLADGTRVADTITLLKRRITNTFTFIGTVEVISDTSWTISGRTVFMDELTEIETGLQADNIVEVQGGIAVDGTFWASSIELFESVDGETFTLEGVVQSISNTVWAVSGFTFTVNVSTTIDVGIVEGDMVRVQGEILANGERQAFSIEKLAAGVEGEFDFVGIVISTEPWNVSGVPLETDAETEIDDGIRVGNRVRVSGRLLTDGTYLATEIEQLDNGARHAIIFTARVESIEPWVVGGVTVTVDSKTKIDAEIEVGDWVTVKGNLLPDSTVLAKKITRVAGHDECTLTTAIVVAIDGSTLTLDNGETITLDDSITLSGVPEVGSTVLITACENASGELVVIKVEVMGDEGGTPTPTLTPTPDLTPVPGEKVTICHIPPGNPTRARTITVDAAAVPAHLGHGDTLGPCK